jgi:5-oxoprolinase (ATP-hydrolysing)
LRCLSSRNLPLSEGVLRRIELRIPTGLLNPPGHSDPALCPAVVAGNVETSQRIVDCFFGALGVAAASQGTMNNLLIGDATFGYYETICGGAGATASAPGASAVHTHMTNTRITDPEVLELRYPLRLNTFKIRRGSGGAGRFPGGDGVTREIEMLAPLTLSLLTSRRGLRPPYGCHGGQPGACGKNLWIHSDGTSEPLPAVAHLEMLPGDRIRIETPGGGGFGTAEDQATN